MAVSMGHEHQVSRQPYMVFALLSWYNHKVFPFSVRIGAGCSQSFSTPVRGCCCRAGARHFQESGQSLSVFDHGRIAFHVK